MELYVNYESREWETKWGAVSQSHASAFAFQYALILSALRELEDERALMVSVSEGAARTFPETPPGSVVANFQLQDLEISL